MMKPVNVLVFSLLVFTLLGVISLLFPKEGISITAENKLRFPSVEELFFPEEKQVADISHILDLETDSAELIDKNTAAVEEGKSRAEQLKLHYPNNNKSVLHNFFKELEKANSGKKPIRIMHFGDSQLEGDRITSYVRNKLQNQFGGYGPGLFAVKDIVSNFSVKREISENWIRYSVMGKQDFTLNHKRYGAVTAFSRFTPIVPDSLEPDTAIQKAWIKLGKARRAYGKAQTFKQCKLFYGYHRKPVTVQLKKGEELISEDLLWPSKRMNVKTWKFDSTPEDFTINFKGADSPEIYGISLQGNKGVNMDNIAMRGASGTEFRKLDRTILQPMFDTLNVKLLILQYGGNVMPYMKSQEKAEKYGKWFGSQITRLKGMIPGVSIIVIGPSDMATKVDGEYVTRPYLEDVRDAMKKYTLANGGVYWDLYEAMGGKNSMVSWVEADPALAAKDYTHFSYKGAKKVAELFYNALINDYNEYKK